MSVDKPIPVQEGGQCLMSRLIEIPPEFTHNLNLSKGSGFRHAVSKALLARSVPPKTFWNFACFFGGPRYLLTFLHLPNAS